MNREGEPAPQTGRLIKREVIGPPECPILTRWTLLKFGRKGRKLMLHRFWPDADDRDVHDHPWTFWTLVLAGAYDDLIPCPACTGTGTRYGRPCRHCDGTTLVLGTQMRPGKLKRRPAHHQHRTKAGPNGCWTLVWAGGAKRRWGFWRDGRWWHWQDYERKFGFGMRCDRDEEE